MKLLKVFLKKSNNFSFSKKLNFSSKVCKVDNPYTQELHIEKRYTKVNEIPSYLENAESASNMLKSLSIDDRIKLVQNAMKWFEDNKTLVATEISSMMGKPLNNALGEINTMFARCNSICSIAKEALIEDEIEVTSSTYVKIKKEPIGTTFMISPWNYPLITVINNLVASILCGNPVLLKHSIRTPLVGDFFQTAFKSTGANHVVQHLFLYGPDIPQLYKAEQINFVGFTGSVETGQVVLKNIADNNRFIHSVFELGGKDGVYVRPDADLDFTVASVVDGAMYNAGQSCCSVERVYVHESVYEKFIDKATEEIKKYRLGNPLGEKNSDGNIIYPSYGPMALPDSLTFIKEQVTSAGEEGAEIILGGNITTDSSGKGRFFEPTLIKNAENSMSIMQKETFGPVMPVCKVSSDNEAIRKINDSVFGLTASIYSKNYKETEKLLGEINAGTVFMNKCDSLHPLLPWSGRKNSGVGIGLSKYGFNAFYRTKGYNFALPK